MRIVVGISWCIKLLENNGAKGDGFYINKRRL